MKRSGATKQAKESDGELFFHGNGMTRIAGCLKKAQSVDALRISGAVSSKVFLHAAIGINHINRCESKKTCKEKRIHL